MTTKLRADVNKKLDTWNEHSMFTLKGVRNLSRSDMDDLLFFADMLELHGASGFHFIMGRDVQRVWESYGLPAPR